MILINYIFIGHGSNISGNVLLSEGAYIGSNACVLQGESEKNQMILGAYATIGAGAVVTKDVPDNVVVKGVPAK